MKEKLHSLIAIGKTKQVLDELLIFAKELKDDDLIEEVLMQLSHFEKYAESNRKGILTFEEDRVNSAKINNAILQIIRDYPIKCVSRKK